MKEILERCCGLDVHKETVVACIMLGTGKKTKKEIKTFSTITEDLLKLKKWLKSLKITHIAMESSGIYWKPIFNILGESFELLLVNAKHVKNVPGRKTDVKDSEWICKLLKNGLLEKNFIPPEQFRNLRDLTRYRKKIVETIVSEKNRILKVLETANIKLSSIVSNSFGVAGWNIIKDLSNGITDPKKKLAKYKTGNTKASLKEFERALTGRVTPHHTFLLKKSIDIITYLENVISDIEKEQDQILKSYQKEIELMQTVPGVKKTSATVILAEIGNDMDQFPTSQHLSSWAGICPGNNESAGKKKVLEQTPAIKY
jgi:transposase